MRNCNPHKGFVFEITVVMYYFSLVDHKTAIKIQILYLETILWYPNGLALEGFSSGGTEGICTARLNSVCTEQFVVCLVKLQPRCHSGGIPAAAPLDVLPY